MTVYCPRCGQAEEITPQVRETGHVGGHYFTVKFETASVTHVCPDPTQDAPR